MIIGHGDIASAIPDRPDRLYFASGVSNSGETRLDEFLREASLLFDQDPHAHLVYFSSLCVFYSDTDYAEHKRLMERRIKNTFGKYTIVRLGNISWGANKTTLINHLRAQHDAGLPVDLQDVYRYVVDKAEFLHWLNMIPAWPAEINIPGQRLKVVDIYRRYVLQQTAIADFAYA